MTAPTTVNAPAHDAADSDNEPLLAAWLLLLWRRLWLLLGIAALAGAAGYGASYLVPPTFVSATSFLPPQQASNGGGALAALGSLAGLAGGGQARNTADQYVALMQSATVSDRMIDQFKLMAAYDVDLRVDARLELAKNVRIAAGKKDGLVVVEVEDRDPQRAAKMANQYIEELRRMTSTIAVTEAQQRRVFFERQLQATKQKLIEAQLSLQSTGFNQASLQAEPKAAAETYAKLRAEATSAEVRLQTLRSALTDSAPEVQAQQTLVGALRSKVAGLEQATAKPNDPGYVARYREFKYQETLFELLARQFETARVDEGREGALLQVVDVASAAERKFKPKRSLFAGAGLAAGFLLAALWVLSRTERR